MTGVDATKRQLRMFRWRRRPRKRNHGNRDVEEAAHSLDELRNIVAAGGGSPDEPDQGRDENSLPARSIPDSDRRWAESD